MARAAVPEEIWTGVPPAKSSPPRTKDQPLEFHVQQAMGSYTMVDQTKTKTIMGPSLPRSAMAPMASIGLHGFVEISGWDLRSSIRDIRDGSEHELEDTEND